MLRKHMHLELGERLHQWQDMSTLWTRWTHPDKRQNAEESEMMQHHFWSSGEWHQERKIWADLPDPLLPHRQLDLRRLRVPRRDCW